MCPVNFAGPGKGRLALHTLQRYMTDAVRAWPPCDPFSILFQEFSLYRMGVRTAQHVSVPLGGSGMQFSQMALAGQCSTSPVLLNFVWSVAEYLHGRLRAYKLRL